MRTAICTALALTGFAGNSLLCRAALRDGAIDAVSFTAVRLASGAATLGLLQLVLRRRNGHGVERRIGGSWSAALMLFAYALPFSLAYRALPTGTGALLLFGAVQATMLTAGRIVGERPHAALWAGFAVAVGGLVHLVLPGLGAPDPGGAALMLVAGVAWAGYSLRGRGSLTPLDDTAGNFARCVVLLPVLAVVWVLPIGAEGVRASAEGLGLGFASGALASGVGYAVWYAAVPGLTVSRAALAQLAVPVIAGAAGVVLLGEELTGRLVLASVLVLGGVSIALRAPERARSAR